MRPRLYTRIWLELFEWLGSLIITLIKRLLRMPEIRKDKSGIYFLDLYTTVIDDTGTPRRIRKRISLGTRNLKAARIAAKIKERELGTPQAAHIPSLPEFIDEFSAWYRSSHDSTSDKDYRAIFTDFITVANLNTFAKVNARTVDWYLARLSEKHRPATVNKYLRILKAIFNRARRWNYIQSNPFENVKPAKFHLDPPRILSEQEITAIFAQIAAWDEKYLPLFRFYLYTGLRRDEALRLEWKFVYFDKNYIFVKGKQKKSRIVPLFPQAKQILLDRRNYPQPFRFNKDWISEVYKDMARKAGINNTKLHDLRRTWSTRLEESGFTRELIRKWGGWTHDAVMDAHYIGNSEDFLKKVTAFERVIFRN